MLKTVFAFLMLGVASSSAISAEIGEDGLHKQDWFSVTFKDMNEDLETAKEDGKRLVIFLEQRGCIYCREVHEKVLSDPEVRDFIRENYMVVQFNLHGDEEVVDFDGDVLSEKTAAKKWGVLFTPSIIFMPETADPTKAANEQAVSIMPGAFRKGTFLDMFKWVHAKGYEGEETFQQFHARNIRERQATGSTLD